MNPKILALVFAGALVAPALFADEYDTLRARWVEMLTGGSTFNTADPDIAPKLTALATAVASNGTSRDPVNGTGHWDKLDTSAGRTYLWSDLTSTTISAQITTAYGRVKAMALAWATRGSTLEGNTALAADIVGALDWLYANRYNENITKYDNWWDWDIGIPLGSNDCIALVYSQLNTTQLGNYFAAIDKYTASVSDRGGGANRMWKTKIVGLRGVLGKNSSKITTAKSSISTLLNYNTTSGDGMYADGSVIFHSKHPYTGGYGISMIVDLTDYIYLYDGSTWQITDPKEANAFAWLYDSFEPVIYKGEMMDMLRGREISRNYTSGHVAGRKVVGAFLRATQIAPSADVANYKRTIKAWLNDDTTFATTYTNLSIYDILLAKAIMADNAVTPRAELTGHYAFSAMARAVHLAAGWGAGVSQHSTRIYNYETANGENKQGWHTSAGQLYVYNADITQFGGNFWPTVNPYRLPGITLVTGTKPSGNLVSGAAFVGGVESYALQYGVTGMDLAPAGTTLAGRKAWFFFDDEIVSLGAGIASTGTPVVETVVENRRLTASGTNAFLVDNATALATLQTAPGTASTLNVTSWAHLAGNVSGADLGYYFPGGATLKGLRETRTGKWSTIDTRAGTDATLYSNNYLTLWYDHGATPTAASYSYAILPNYTSSAVQAYAATPEFTVLENSAAAQAVKETTLNAVAALFWQDATKTIGSGSDAITVDKKAAVFTDVSTNGTEIKVAVSDPTQLNTGTITVTLARTATSTIDNDSAITVVSLNPIQFTLAASGLKGMSKRVRFGVAAPTWTITDNPPGAAVTYAGAWTHSTDATFYNSTKSVSNTVGNTVQFAFTGTGARLYVKTNNNLGKLSISIDGGTATLVDCYSASAVNQVKIFEVTGLVSGAHTLVATVATKNPSSTGNYVGIDYFSAAP